MVELKIKLPDDYINAEERSGYHVSSDMKKVWAVELDLLETLLRVCRDHNLKIFADGGTLLGAVREHGFIPWDDDIDLVMMRADYEKLCRIAPKVFKKPYFFQNYHTEKGYPRRHAQFRNIQTTGILKNEMDKCYSFNQGIFLDIFVLDGLYEDSKKQLWQRRRGEFVQKLINARCNPKSRIKIVHYLCKMIPWVFLTKRMDKIVTEKDAQSSRLVVNYGFSFELGSKLVSRERKYYEEDPIVVPFEFVKIPIPKHYDSWLRSRYGDYMKPSKAGAVHSGVIFDTDLSYKNYMKSNGGVQNG